MLNVFIHAVMYESLQMAYAVLTRCTLKTHESAIYWQISAIKKDIHRGLKYDMCNLSANAPYVHEIAMTAKINAYCEAARLD